MLFGLERFEILSDYISQSDYRSAYLNYFTAGINPFYKFDVNLYLNLGINVLFGEEEFSTFSGGKDLNTYFGFSPSQGIFYIPRSGLSAYERFLGSEAYKNDIGFEVELGIKF